MADPVVGSGNGDRLSGTPAGEFILGRPGDDTIEGNGGDDTIFGGLGDDAIGFGVPGGRGRSVVFGGEGSDIVVSRGGSGGNSIVGGTGDAATDASADGADTLDASADTGDDVILGNYGDDVIRAGSGRNTVFGGMGDDAITAGDGGDSLLGGEGADTIRAGNGGNTIVGGSGNPATDSLDGADLIASGNGNDLIISNGGNDTVVAGGGADTAVGGYGDDVVFGNAGDDVLLGNQGVDTLFGGMGNDTLYGGQGDDVLYGNEGSNLLVGGEGDDTAVFAGARSAYTITRDAKGNFIIAGANGTDTVSGIEHFRFGDGTIDAAGLVPPTGGGGPVDQAPVVTAGHRLAYAENQAATAIDPALTVADGDSATLRGAKVTITGGYAKGQDVLAYVAPNGVTAVTGTFDPDTGVLSLKGDASVADYQAALRAVTYQNTSENPSAATRTVAITATDSAGATSAAATDTITVNPVNDAPAATGLTQSLTLDEDAPATKLFTTAPTVNDVDSPSVTATLTLNNSAAGVLTGAGAGTTANGATTYTVTGTPAAVQAALAAVQFDSADNYNGTASVAVAISDGQNGPQGTNPSGTVSITVTPVNDAPAGTDKAITILEDAAYTFAAADFGFTDPQDAASASGANSLVAVQISSLPSNGTLSFDGQPITAQQVADHYQYTASDIDNGLLKFTPAANANGAGYTSFTFQVRDNGGTVNGGQDIDPSPNTITVNVTPVNDAPTLTAAGGTRAYASGGVDLFSNVAATAGPADEASQKLDRLVLTVTNVSGTGESLTVDGTAVALANGTTTTTGSAAVTAAVAVMNGTATVTLSKAGGLSAADLATLVDGLKYVDASVGPNQQPSVVTLTSLRDTGGSNPGTDTAALNLASTVTFNQPPVANDDATTATEKGGANNNTGGNNPSGNVIAGTGGHGEVADTDDQPTNQLVVAAVHTGVEGSANQNTGTIGQALTSANGYGALTLGPDGSYTYTVNQANSAVQVLNVGDTLKDYFNYTIQDSGGAQDTATITVTINGANDAAVIAGDTTGSVTEAGGTNNSASNTPTVSGTLTDTDVDNTSNTFQAVTTATNSTNGYGTYTVTPGGTWTYTLNNNNATVQALNTNSTPLTDTFMVKTADGTAQTVSVTINGADDAPVANPDNATVQSGVQASVNVLSNDTDVDGPALTATNASTPSHGTVVLNINGTFTYTATDGYIGADSFTYQASDGRLSSAAAMVNLTVQPKVAYINSASTSQTQDGSFENPYKTVQAFNTANTASNAYNIVYVQTGSTGTYAGDAITLRAKQYLEGQGVDPYYMQNGTKIVVRDLDNSAGNPQITYTTATPAVTLANGNTIAGLNFVGSDATTVGISGNGINGLTIDRTSVLGFGTAAHASTQTISPLTAEAGIRLINATGTVALTNSAVGYAANDSTVGGYGILVSNETGTLNFTGTGNTISNVQTAASDPNATAGLPVGFQVTTTNSATVTVNLQGNTVSNNRVGFEGDAFNGSTLNANINGTAGNAASTGNTFLNNANQGIYLTGHDSAAVNFNVNSNAKLYNSITQVDGYGTSTLQGRFDGNVDVRGDGFSTTSYQSSQIKAEIVGNTMNTAGGIAILAAADAGSNSVANGNARTDATIVGNTITLSGASATDGSYVQGVIVRAIYSTGAQAASAQAALAANVRNNSIISTDTGDNATYDYAFVLTNDPSTNAKVYLQGYTSNPGSYAYTGEATLRNNGNTLTRSSGSNYYYQDYDTNGPSAVPTGAPYNGNVRTPTNPSAQLAGSGGVAAATPSAGVIGLSQAQLDGAVAAALVIWAEAGLSPAQIAQLKAVTYGVGSTMGGWLGESTPGHVTISADAGGPGWFVDATPLDNAEFAHALSATHLTADPTSAAAGHYDLLSTVLHEMGEQIGLDDAFTTASAGSVQHGALSVGERVLPGAADAAAAAPAAGRAFLYDPGGGAATAADFAATGPAHDVLVLPDSVASQLAAVLSAGGPNGPAVLDFGGGNTLTLPGTSAAVLKAHPEDFAFSH